MPESAPGSEQDAATKAALLRSLATQRNHVLGQAEGLTDEQLRTVELPSGWSMVGLIRHLAVDVERYWFSCILGGAPLDAVDEGLEGADGDDRSLAWRVPDDQPASEVLSLYRTAIEAADRVIAGVALDAEPAQRDSWWGEWQVPDVRFVLLHVITETACHAGHADAVRELLDGKQWIVL